jgi:hypothetical protein
VTVLNTRLSIRLERSELLWSAAVVLIVAIGLALVAAMTTSLFAAHQPCDADFLGSGCGPLSSLMRPWSQTGQTLVGLLWLLPIVLGSLLGVAITAGELERRTAPLSWTLDGSRRRWLGLRLIPTTIALMALLTVAAVAAELLTRSRLVTDQPGFVDYQLRTAALPLRGALSLSIGFAVGALMGRVLLSLLIAIGFSVAALYGSLAVMDILHTRAATFVLLEDLTRNAYPLIAASGRTIRSGLGEGVLQVPVSEFAFWISVEAAILLAATLTVGALGYLVIRRRSPR